MTSDRSNLTTAPEVLLGRVVSILEQARANVVRAVNTAMVAAYWLIGREIVQELQAGEERAGYGRQVVEKLSVQLTERYGKGFSATNLWDFRLFYQAYADRLEIPHPVGGEFVSTEKIRPAGGELVPAENRSPLSSEAAPGFSPLLSWSHYRALMRVQDEKTRAFYEQEAVQCGWSKAQLER